MSKIKEKILNNSMATFLLGSGIGILVFLWIYGVEVLDVTNVAWLLDSQEIEGLWDLKQHYLGWVLYRNTPWTFPIGLLDGVAAESISVAYTDSIPLFAIFFKILSPILPESFQYFGLFELLTYALIGGLGSLITYRFTKNIYFNGICGLFFVISPVLTKRVFYHSALSAHFLILAAICLWIYRDQIGKKRYIVYWGLLSMLCTLINPYYVPMVLGILLCSLLQEFIVKRNLWHCILCAGIPAVLSLAIGWPLGLFYGQVSAAAEGIEKVSFNLNQFINPGNSMLIHDGKTLRFSYTCVSAILRGQPLHSDWQNEGFAYLGLGVLLAMAVIIIMTVKRAMGGLKQHCEVEKLSYIIAILVGIIVFTLLAMGPVGTWNATELYHIPWPEKIYQLFAVFRTAGRLIWPVYYGLMALTFIGIIRFLSSERRRLMLLLCCLVLQLIDLWPSLKDKHDKYSHVAEDYSFENELMASELWSYLGESGSEIIFGVPTGMTICFYPYWSCTFEEYAIAYGLQMSASYCSRDVSMMADAYAVENFRKREDGKTYPSVIYVFLFDDMIENHEGINMNLYRWGTIVLGTDLDLTEYSDEVEAIR